MEINEIVNGMNSDDLKMLVINLASNNEGLRDALYSFNSGVDVRMYKIKLALAIKDSLYWQDYDSDYEYEANLEVLEVLGELDGMIKMNKSLKEVVEILLWLLDTLIEDYTCSIDGEISESINKGYMMLKDIALIDKRFNMLVTSFMLENLYSYSGCVEEVIERCINDIFNSLDLNESYSLSISEDVICYFDRLSDILKDSSKLAEIINLMDGVDY